MEDFKDLGNKILESLDDLKKLIIKSETSQESEIKTHKRYEIRGNIKLDNFEQKLIVNGTEKQLTYKEWAIIREFINSPDGMRTLDELCENIYGYTLDDSAKCNIRTAISRIRQKASDIIILKTVKGVGYLLKERNKDDGTD